MTQQEELTADLFDFATWLHKWYYSTKHGWKHRGGDGNSDKHISAERIVKLYLVEKSKAIDASTEKK